MNSHVSHRLAVAQQIDQICCCYEAAWQAGSRPNLVDDLPASPPSLRDAVVLELIPIELQYSKLHREPIPSSTSFDLFPHLREQLESFLTDRDAVSLVAVQPGGGFARLAGRVGFGVFRNSVVPKPPRIRAQESGD